MKRHAFLTGVLMCAAQLMTAQAGEIPAAAPVDVGAAEATEITEPRWDFTLSAYTYFVPDDRDYVQPTFTADRGRLHLEARYNYEASDTGSVWLGGNFSSGEAVSLEFTPMLGAVFGDITGVAPGYKGTLSWWKIELYSEAEYFAAPSSPSENFFYTWSELTLVPADWFRIGAVIQRTKLYQTEFDIQRGFLVGFSVWRLDLTAYVFNPDKSHALVVLGASLAF